MATQVAPEEDAAGAGGPGTLRKQGTVSTENMFYDDEDGVDKLTSCEQSCLPGFWLDSGVPPLPVLRWVFDPRNKYFNDNKYAHIFGNVGFRYFDERRKWYMGWATAFTVLSIAATMAITIALVQPTKLLHARRSADFASHGLTQAKSPPASTRTAASTDDAVPRRSSCVGG